MKTDAEVTDVLERLLAGASQGDVARAMGMTKRTIQLWLQRGRDGDPKYADFARRYDEAQRLRMPGPKSRGDEANLQIATWRACLAGSVPAMRLYWEMLKAGAPAKSGRNPFAHLTDEPSRRGLTPSDQLPALVEARVGPAI